jgi:hypothetical protein
MPADFCKLSALTKELYSISTYYDTKILLQESLLTSWMEELDSTQIFSSYLSGLRKKGKNYTSLLKIQGKI